MSYTMMEEIAITSPEPVDISAIAPIVRIKMPPEEPKTFSAISGVTKPTNVQILICLQILSFL
jgi:hypothetical protein